MGAFNAKGAARGTNRWACRQAGGQVGIFAGLVADPDPISINRALEPAARHRLETIRPAGAVGAVPFRKLEHGAA